MAAFWVALVLFILVGGFVRYVQLLHFKMPALVLSDTIEMPYLIGQGGSFVLEFNQRMNKASVEKAVVIEPETGYTTSWKKNTLFLTPDRPLQEGILYYVSIGRSAHSILGKPLEKEYVLHFKKGKEPEIAAIFPTGKQIQPDEKLIMIFSHPMVSESEVAKNSMPPFLKMSPFVPGSWVWRDTKVLVFSPEGGFPLSSRISVESLEEIRTYDNALLKDRISLQFETERLAFEKVDDEQMISINEPMRIRFNQPVDPKQLLRFLSVENRFGEPLTDMDVALVPQTSATYSLQKKTPWNYNDEYRVSVSPELMPSQGNLSLEEGVEQVFKTESIFHEEVFRLSSDDRTLMWNGEKIPLTLKEDFSVETLRKSISFIPDASFELIKKEERTFEISFPIDSQKRENMEMYVSTDINSETRTYIARPVKFFLQTVDELSLEMEEQEAVVCIRSNYPLAEETSINAESASWKLPQTAAEACEREGEYAYEFEKRFLPPGRETTLNLLARDTFGQASEEQITISTPSLKVDQVQISSTHPTFYTAVATPEKMQFVYRTTNLSRVLIQACQIDSLLAVRIEGGYEEKWNSFAPSAEKCLQYKSYYVDIEPTWGVEQEMKVDLRETFDEQNFGLYYIQVASTEFFDQDGRTLNASGVLNYTRWNVLSKRGKSALVWVMEGQAPVSNAIVNLYSSDGRLLESGKTDRQGVFFQEKNLISYEYVLVKKGEEEVLLNVFSQDGFEPHRYSVPFDSEESPYLYQFFFEDPNANDRAVKGVFILKEKQEGILTTPNIKGANVTLYDESEQLLGRKFETFDDYGNLFFEVQTPHALLDGRYQLGVCLGLYEGVCHGTYLWTTFQKGVQAEAPEVHPVPKAKEMNHAHIRFDASQEVEVGKEQTIAFEGLIPNVPALVTVERDRIFFKKILFPKASEDSMTITIQEEMVPEMMVSVSQLNTGKSVYDLQRIKVQKQAKKLIYDPKLENWNADGKPEQKIAEVIFQLGENGVYQEKLLFDSFYPRYGTSIITSAFGDFPFVQHSQENDQLVVDQIPASIIVDGVISSEKNLGEHPYYLLAHDEKGRFGSMTVSQKREIKTLAMSVELPDFIRGDDQVILPVTIQNNSDELKNVQLISTATGLEFINGGQILIGVPAQQEKLLLLGTKIKPMPGQKTISLDLQLVSDGFVEAHVVDELPLLSGRSLEYPSHLLVHESPNGSGSVELSTEGLGHWKSRIILSTSPLSYVLENVKNLLQKESLSFDESVFKRIVEANYAHLMKDSWIQNDMIKTLQQKMLSSENLLYYLESRQKNDGGWSEYPEQSESDPILSSWMAKSLSTLEQIQLQLAEDMRRKTVNYLKSELDRRVNLRLRDEIQNADLSEKEIFEELQILNGLSSLNPSGIPYANTWYSMAEKLPTHSLVLLLLTLEDYRDAGISGMQFKIEELTQLLKTRQQQVQSQIWLSGDKEQEIASDYLVTSWYLEALVRQASARDDIPAIITWLTRNKYQQEYQSPKDQFSYLQAMASYLRIYQEQVTASQIQVKIGDGEEKIFQLTPEQQFQSFSIEQIFTQTDDDSSLNRIEFSTDTDQPLFIEANWKKLGSSQKAVNNGISLYQSFDDTQLKQGGSVKGQISIITPEPLQNVVITHPYLSGATPIRSLADQELWKTKTFANDEVWYLFPELPAGETVIPFEWELDYAGIFTTPQLQAFVISQPKTLSTSNTVRLEVRNGE